MKRLTLIIALILIIPCISSAKTQYKVTARAYTAHKNQTDSNPNETAYGNKPKKGVTIAVSPDLKHLKNKKVKLITKDNKVIGVFKVDDKMAKRHRKSIDIFFGRNKKLAKEFGVQRKVKLIVL